MDILEKAKELGELITKSDEFIRFKKAEENQIQSEVAQALIAAYNNKRKQVAEKMKKGNLSDGESESLIKELNLEFETISKNEVIREYIDARKAFDSLYKKVTDIINFCITGEEQGCDKSKCSSCSGCK